MNDQQNALEFWNTVKREYNQYEYIAFLCTGSETFYNIFIKHRNVFAELAETFLIEDVKNEFSDFHINPALFDGDSDDDVLMFSYHGLGLPDSLDTTPLHRNIRNRFIDWCIHHCITVCS